MEITIKDLYKLVKKQIDKGNGDKAVLISNDVEGNGCHPLFYEFTDQDNIEALKSLLEMECDGNHTIDNCVILG